LLDIGGRGVEVIHHHVEMQSDAAVDGTRRLNSSSSQLNGIGRRRRAATGIGRR
jgi:hypothetical protein